MRVDRPASALAPSAGRRPVRGGFRVPDEPASAAAVAGPPALAPVTPGPAPAAAEGAGADARARRQARAMLDGLSELQLALLEDRGDPARLLRLKELAEDAVGGTADPALAGIAAAVALRLRIELARRGAPAREDAAD